MSCQTNLDTHALRCCISVRIFHALCSVVSNMRIDDGYLVTKPLRQTQGLVLECCIHIADIMHQNAEVRVHFRIF